MRTTAADSAIKAKATKEWATQQSPYTLNKMLKWSKTLTETVPNLGEASSYELLGEILLLVGDSWIKYPNT